MGLGLGWPRAVAQGYSYSCNKIEFGCKFLKNLMSSSKIRLRLGWLRAVAQDYSDSYNTMKLGSNCQRNLASSRVEWN